MKRAFLFSLVLNAILGAATIGFALFRPAPEVPVVASSAAIELKPQSVAAAAVSVTEPAASPAPFNWSQVESADDVTFISRLRAIGCPEKTIRQIVMGNVADLQAGKSRQLQERMGRPLMPSEIQKLEQEQAAVVAGIFQKAGGGNTPGIPGQDVQSQTVAAPAQLPLVLQNVAPSSSGVGAGGRSSSPAAAAGASPTAQPLPPLTPAQQEALGQIAQKFANDVGGPNQNPDDPQYLARWTKAQTEADDLMRSMMGATYFNAYQISAATQAYEKARQGGN